MKKPKYRIIKHTASKETYYTLEYRGLLWGWNSVKRFEYIYGSSRAVLRKFETIDLVYKYIDSVQPEKVEIIEVIY